MAAVAEKLLKDCPIFHGLEASDLSVIAEMLRVQKMPAGWQVLHEGDFEQALWIISEGQCAVMKGPRETEQQLAVLDPYSVFGEMSFFTAGPHSASVKTLKESELLYLTREQFEVLLQTNPKAAHRMAVNTIGILADRVRRMDEWTKNLVLSAGKDEHQAEWLEFRAKLYRDWQF
ncbi:MAG: cyclic nucleotide-binding domain-containing protein [Planctomycetaceae bacterium]